MFAIQNTEDSWQQDQDNISDTEYKQEVLTGRRGTREMSSSVWKVRDETQCFPSLWFWFWFCCPHTDSLSRIRSISSWHREQHKVQKRLDDLSTWPSAPERPVSPWSCWSGPGGSACTRWFSSWSVWACPGNSSSRLWPSPAGTVKNRTVGSVQTRNILLGLWPFLQTETETEPSQQAARQGLKSEHAGKQTLLGWHIDQWWRKTPTDWLSLKITNS